MREQNLQLARAIARSYQVDETHIAQVERFAVQLCRHLVDFGINERMVFVLRTAIILSEVGKFVSLRNHSEHAYRIIMGTDLFGLSDREKEVVANVVFYHYKGKPDDDDENFRYLKEVQKIWVSKFVAVLRCMRALDVSHKLKVSSWLLNAMINASWLKQRRSKTCPWKNGPLNEKQNTLVKFLVWKWSYA